MSVDGDDELVGFALLVRENEVAEPALIVGPRFRGHGHAKRTMAELEQREGGRTA